MEVATGSTYAHRLVDAFRRFADQPAMKWKQAGEWVQLSYAELGHQVFSLAAVLIESGVQKGDRIAIYLETSRPWILMDFALQIVGAVTTTVYPTLPAEQAKKILHDAEVKGLLTTPERLKALEVDFGLPASCEVKMIVAHDERDSFESLLGKGAKLLAGNPSLTKRVESPDVELEDLSAIIYTSGTTGEPKGAMLSHRNAIANADAGIQCFAMARYYVNFVHLPLAHVVARNMVVPTAVMTGDLMAIAESDRNKWPANFLEVRPVGMVTVPYLLDKIYDRVMDKIAHQSLPLRILSRWALAEGYRCRVQPLLKGGPVRERATLRLRVLDSLVLKKIRAIFGGRLVVIVTGAAHIRLETVAFFWALGIQVYEAYGMTEVTTAGTFTWHQDIKLGTVGKAAPGMQVKLADDGEVLLKGPSVMKGYWKQPEATAKVIDADGWYHTGDIGSFDNAGYLSIVDRKRDLFVLDTGKNVAPQAVENALKRSACVENVCVVGDQRRYIVALIVPALDVIQQRLGLSNPPDKEDPRVKALLDDEVAKYSVDLAVFERVKRYELLSEPFSTDNELLTPTLKLRRKKIIEQHKGVIEGLYRH